MIRKIKIKKNKGALLLELLIVISVLAIVLSIGANAIYLSGRSNKSSGERDVASALASEALESVRAVADEDWHNIYSLTKSSQHYYPIQSNGKWILTTTVEDGDISLNGLIYSRYVVIENACRDEINRNVTGVASCSVGSSDDPSTQKITVTVNWSGGNPIVISEYFFRWKNKICNQTDWSGGVGSGAKNCPDNTHGGISPSGTIDVNGGQLKLQQ
jgi:type II secretory pathway pseudopilin PulG